MRFLLLCIAITTSGCSTLPWAGRDAALREQAVIIPPSVQAAPLDPQQQLDLDDAIQRALLRNPQRNALRAEVDWVYARARARSAPRAAQARLSAGESNGDGQAQLAFRFYPETPWGRDTVRLRTEFLARFAETRLDAREHEIAMTVRARFLELHQQQRLQRHLDQVVALRDKHFMMINALVREGEALASDAMEAKLDLLDAVTEQKRIARERARTLGELAVDLGLRESLEEQQLDLSALTAGPAPAELQAGTLIQSAYEQRADLAAAAWRMQVAEVDRKAARLLRMPWFSHLQASFTEESHSRNASGASRERGETWSIQTAVDLPFSREVSAEIERREAETARYAAVVARLRAEIGDGVRLSLAGMHAAWAEVQRIEAERSPILKTIQQALDNEQIGGTFRAKLRSDLELRVIEAARVHLEALDRYENTRLALRQSMGAGVPRP